MNNSTHRLVELVLTHTHARVCDRENYNGISLEGRGHQVITIAWPAENPDHVNVNGVMVSTLRLLRACRERRAKLLGTEDRIAQIVDDFLFESAITGKP